MEELNKKMQGFAGISAEGINGLNYPINFPDDLNACFKYIVPKLHRASIVYSMGKFQSYAQLTDGGKWQDAQTDSPALAFCLAVEKLIDA